MWGGRVKMEDIPDFSNLFLASQLLWPTPLAGTPPPPTIPIPHLATIREKSRGSERLAALTAITLS